MDMAFINLHHVRDDQQTFCCQMLIRAISTKSLADPHFLGLDQVLFLWTRLAVPSTCLLAIKSDRPIEKQLFSLNKLVTLIVSIATLLALSQLNRKKLFRVINARIFLKQISTLEKHLDKWMNSYSLLHINGSFVIDLHCRELPFDLYPTSHSRLHFLYNLRSVLS